MIDQTISIRSFIPLADRLTKIAMVPAVLFLFLLARNGAAQATSSGPEQKSGAVASSAERHDAAQPVEGHTLKTQRDKVNYAIGVQLMGNFKRQGFDMDLDLVVKGMRDALAGGPYLLSDGELRKSVSIYHDEVKRKMAKLKTHPNNQD